MEWLVTGLIGAAAFYLAWRKRRDKTKESDNPTDGAGGSVEALDARDNETATRSPCAQAQSTSAREAKSGLKQPRAARNSAKKGVRAPKSLQATSADLSGSGHRSGLRSTLGARPRLGKEVVCKDCGVIIHYAESARCLDCTLAMRAEYGVAPLWTYEDYGDDWEYGDKFGEWPCLVCKQQLCQCEGTWRCRVCEQQPCECGVDYEEKCFVCEEVWLDDCRCESPGTCDQV